MGLIPPDYFPIEVPPGIVLMGDYDIGIINPNNTSFGTHIIFPYLYEGGYSNYTQDLFDLCYTWDTGTFDHKGKGSGLSGDDVHSGLAAYKGWVRPFNKDYVDDPGAVYETNRYYNAPGRYKAVKQYYQWNAPLRQGAFTLKVIPNPSLSGSSVHVFCIGTGYESLHKTLTVYSTQGNAVVKTQFAGEHYTLTENLKPGVYIVAVECEGKQEKKKLVITN